MKAAWRSLFYDSEKGSVQPSAEKEQSSSLKQCTGTQQQSAIQNNMSKESVNIVTERTRQMIWK